MVENKNHYWMYSKHAIQNAILNPDRKIKEMLVEERLKDYYEKFFRNNKIKKNIKINVANKALIIKKIGKLAKYQGIALYVEKILVRTKLSLNYSTINNNFLLILDKLNDPINFGAILRVSYAFGINTIIIPDRYMPDENGYIASIASGALDKINIIKVKNIINIINYLKKNNWWVIGLESKKLEACINLKNQNSKYEKKALIIGSESRGISHLVRKNCDLLYRIPTKNDDLDSINVVQATSIALYELT